MAKATRKDDHSDNEPELVALARGLAEVVSAHGLAELIVDTKDTTLTIRKSVAAPAAQVAAAPMPMMAAPAPFSHAAAPIPSAPAASAAPAPAVDDKAHVVTSPFVGTFYRKPNPDSPNYVALNDRVDKGAVLCIVEAMKLMNEIEADVSGTIIAILVEDGAPVEYGQPLFKITA